MKSEFCTSTLLNVILPGVNLARANISGVSGQVNDIIRRIIIIYIAVVLYNF